VTPDTIKAGTEIFVEFLLGLAAASESGAKLVITIVTAGLAPAAVTEGVGAVVKVIIGTLAFMIATSRGDFETGFESVLLALPVCWRYPQQGLQIRREAYGKYKARLMNAVNKVPGVTGNL